MAGRGCSGAGFTPHHVMVVHQSCSPRAAVCGLVKDSSRSGVRRGCGERHRSSGSSGGCNSRSSLAKLHSAWFSTLIFNFQYSVTTDFQYDWLLRATRPTLALASVGESDDSDLMSNASHVNWSQSLSFSHSVRNSPSHWTSVRILGSIFHHFSSNSKTHFRLFFSSVIFP